MPGLIKRDVGRPASHLQENSSGAPARRQRKGMASFSVGWSLPLPRSKYEAVMNWSDLLVLDS